MSYHSNCNVMVCRFYIRNKLNIPMNTLTFNVFFSSENKNIFKNLNSLNLCSLPFIFEPVYAINLEKRQVFSRGFFRLPMYNSKSAKNCKSLTLITCVR